MNENLVFEKGKEGRETTELFMKLNAWSEVRRFVISRVLKPKEERKQLSLFESLDYEYFFFVTNTNLTSEQIVTAYEKRGNSENYIKESMIK